MGVCVSVRFSVTSLDAKRHLCRSLIEHHLAQGTNVIADRYAFSGIAFSAAKVSRADCQS